MAKLSCPACGKQVGSKSALSAHVNKEHGDSSLIGIMAKWGDMAPRPGGAWKPGRPLRAAPSGIPSIDYAIGIGGVPRGTLIEIFGPPGSGKTVTALTFSAHAQGQGALAGYVDAERRFQETMAKLVPGLNLDTLYFGLPKGGEVALNMSKDYIGTGLYDVWTIDSVHGCTPKALMDKPIGDATMAELAKLMSVGCQVLDEVISETNTVCIFVNHMKSIPGVKYGKDWSKPGGSALDYYASVQLHVRPSAIWLDENKRKIGHTVRVRVENSKVAAPYATAEYDLYYRHGKIKTTDKQPKERDGQVVRPGIDVGSCWASVCDELGLVVETGNKWSDTETGELLGTRRDLIAMLEDDCNLRQRAHEQIYGRFANKTKEDLQVVEAAAA